jgi:ATP phosphoribosyltransferase regulatory subunit
VEAPEGTIEVIEILSAALDAADLPRARIGLGDAGLYRGLLAGMGADDRIAAAVLHALERHDFVELEACVEELRVSGKRQETLVKLPQLRGGADILDHAVELGGEDVSNATRRLRDVAAAVEERGLGDRVIFDLGLVRDLGYYTGAIFEVYDPAVGHVIGAGGRYDDLIGRFGDSRPACGFALFVERLHVAQAEEERRTK